MFNEKIPYWLTESGFKSFTELLNTYGDILDEHVHNFKSVCYNVASKLNGKLVGFDFDLSARSFLLGKIEIGGQINNVLLTYHGIAAFASSVEYSNIKFVDNPRLMTEFEMYYTIVPKIDMELPFIIDETYINEGFIKSSIKYWKPETIGNVLFNFWD